MKCKGEFKIGNNKFMHIDNGTLAFFTARTNDKESKNIGSLCLHCGENIPMYCEDCYQKLVAENARLQLEINALRNTKDTCPFMATSGIRCTEKILKGE